MYHAFEELVIIDIPQGASMVCKPRGLVGRASFNKMPPWVLVVMLLIVIIVVKPLFRIIWAKMHYLMTAFLVHQVSIFMNNRPIIRHHKPIKAKKWAACGMQC